MFRQYFDMTISCKNPVFLSTLLFPALIAGFAPAHAKSAISTGKFRNTGDYFYLAYKFPYWQSAPVDYEMRGLEADAVNDRAIGNDTLPVAPIDLREKGSGWEFGTHTVNEKVTAAKNFHFSYMRSNPDSLTPTRFYRLHREFPFNSSSVSMDGEGYEVVNYDFNRARNWELGYNYDIYFLGMNKNQFINTIALRLGANLTADQAELEGPRIGGSTISYSEPTLNASATSDYSLTSSVSRDYRMGHLELLAGTNYVFGLFDLLRIDLGIDFIYGKGLGKYETMSRAYIFAAGSSLPLIWESRMKEELQTTVQGYRGEAGISLLLSGMSIRLGYREDKKRYYIDKRKYKFMGTEGESAVHYVLTGDPTPILVDQTAPVVARPNPVFTNREIDLSVQIEI